jgi:hypothetical protein
MSKLKPGELTTAFKTYWDDMDRCRRAKAYWSLLHVTVCLPDICAALQADDGETTGGKYKDWCKNNLDGSMLTEDERRDMRNKVLHQGRALTKVSKRYKRFAFGQPASNGKVDHLRVEVETLHLDVGELAKEMQQAVESWIQKLEENPRSPEAKNVGKNLPSLVRVTESKIPTATTEGKEFMTFNKTN